jgi:hypothetical protein
MHSHAERGNENKPRRMLNITPIVTMLCCLGGIWYNASSLKAAWSHKFDDVQFEQETPYFYHAFYIMSFACVLFYIVLIALSIEILRGVELASTLLCIVLSLEVVYFFVSAAMWTHPNYGSSIAAAFGVANGGLLFQFATLLPLWAPIVLWTAN